jgi:hypothetical protein
VIPPLCDCRLLCVVSHRCLCRAGYGMRVWTGVMWTRIGYSHGMNTRSHKGWGLTDWLWWDETDVSELWPLQAFCSSTGDLQCGPWMIILTEGNSQLVYQSAVAAPSIVWWSYQQRHLWQPSVLCGFLPSETSLEQVGGGQRKWEFSLSAPMVLLEMFYMP